MAKFKNKISYLLAIVAPLFSVVSVQADDEPAAAGSEEEAKKIFTTTPLENLKQKAFKSFYKKFNSIKLDEHDPRFYKDDGKL